MTSQVEVRPVTADRWDDLLELFGERGAYANCWCTWWRMAAREWDEAGAGGRRHLLESLVAEGRVPGLLAYVDGRPVGWCSVGPRPDFPRMQRSRHVAPVDEVAAWAVNCFWIDRAHRGQGVATALLEAAVAHAFANGAEAVEGIPVDPDVRERDAASAYTGVVGMFANTGFVEVARRAPTARVIMRRTPTP